MRSGSLSCTNVRPLGAGALGGVGHSPAHRGHGTGTASPAGAAATTATGYGRRHHGWGNISGDSINIINVIDTIGDIVGRWGGSGGQIKRY